jgi:hypothetical protein
MISGTLQFFSKPVNMDINRPGIPLEAVIPYFFQQLFLVNTKFLLRSK